MPSFRIIFPSKEPKPFVCYNWILQVTTYCIVTQHTAYRQGMSLVFPRKERSCTSTYDDQQPHSFTCEQETSFADVNLGDIDDHASNRIGRLYGEN